MVAIGGGSGLSVLLRGLKHRLRDGVGELAAVVTVSDDGGSSGRLRREFGVLPPGDIRNCLVALADDEDLLARLFQYRFALGEGLTGHSFGNLFLTALTGITGDFYQAILTAETVLSVKGRILPATLSDVRLRARGQSGRLYEGESDIGKSGEPLREIVMEPARAAPFPPAVEAIEAADLVVLGPGSLYTSLLPNLLIPRIREAVTATRARVVLPLNLMQQPGETEGLSGEDHLEVLERYCGAGVVDVVLLNTTAPGAARLAAYAEIGSAPVEVDPAAIERRGVEVRGADLLAEGELIRHDPDKLSRALLGLLPATPAKPRRGAETG